MYDSPVLVQSEMSDGGTSSDSSTNYINPTPHLDFTTDHHSDDGDDDTLSNQVMISVIVCSILLMTLLAVLVVSSVKLVKFIKTSQNVKQFMEDAAKAEFTRDSNPLYAPNHTPIKLPTYIVEGDLDIKITSSSTNISSDKNHTNWTTDDHNIVQCSSNNSLSLNNRTRSTTDSSKFCHS